jgi:tetratricopeptide (TPR) repeat protein
MSTATTQTRKSVSTTAESSAWNKVDWIAAIVLTGIIAVAYWPALKNGFIWDDDLMLTHNPLIKAGDGLRLIWFTNKPTDFFPLTYTDLWIEWRMWGMNAAGYHLTNILLHAVNAVLLWRVLVKLFEVDQAAKTGFTMAWFAAALFAVHPVNAATVAWIAERKNTLALLFSLLSVLAYLRSEAVGARKRNASYALSLICFVLALLSKTAGVALPVVLLGIAWWKRGLKSRDVIRAIPFFAAAVIMGLVTIWFQNHRALSADFPQRDLMTRIAGVGRALGFYVSKAVVPVGLMPVYPQFAINARSAVALLPDVLLLGVIVVLWVQQKRWGRAALFAFVGFVVMLLPVSGLLSVNYHKFSLVADQWQYFALPFAMAAIVFGLAPALRSARTAVFGVAVVVCVVLSNAHARDFGSDTIWQKTLEKNPECWVAANNLGEQLVEREQFGEALKNFNRALQIKPGYSHALMGVASTYLRMRKYNEAIPPLEELVKSQPNNFFIRFNLGSALLLVNKAQLAAEQFQTALEIPEANIQEDRQWKFGDSDSGTMRAETESRFANALMALGKRDEAVRAYETVLTMTPDAAAVHYRLATLLGKQDREGARKHLREALRIEPGALDALNDLAWSYATDARASAAQKIEAQRLAMQAAQATKFSEPGILDTLAAASAAAGDFDNAVKFGKQGVDVANAKGDKPLAEDLQKRVDGYAQHRPYTE